MKALLNKSFVLVKLDVKENGDKKVLEHPGGDAVLLTLGGEKAGLPFMAVVDPSGKKLINSNENAEANTGNIGYPAAPNEIAHFMAMLRATAPKLSPSELKEIETWLKEHAPKR
jgi:hypothetical protein